MINKKNNYLPYIDGLKGIICILIFAHHFLLAFYPAVHFGSTATVHIKYDLLMAQSPLSFIFNGNFLVHIFCLLSALVISYNLIDNLDINKLANSIFKRYFRLALPVFSLSFIVYLMSRLSLFKTGFTASMTGSNWLLSYYNTPLTLKEVFSSSFINVWFTVDNKFSNAFWMLSYVLHGSILVYILNLMVYKKNRKVIILLLIPLIIYIKLESLLLSYVLGFAIAYIFKKFNIKRTRLFNIFSWLLIILGCFLGGYPTGVIPTNIYSKFIFTNYFLSHAIGSFLLVLGIMLNENIKKVLSKEFLIRLGKISYSVYLVHIPILFSVTCYLFSLLYKGENYVITTIVVGLITFLIVLFSAFLFNKYIEQNWDKLIKYFTNKFEEK